MAGADPIRRGGAFHAPYMQGHIEKRVWPDLGWACKNYCVMGCEPATNHGQMAVQRSFDTKFLTGEIFGCKRLVFPRVAPSREVLFIGLVGQLIYIDGEDSSMGGGLISSGKNGRNFAVLLSREKLRFWKILLENLSFAAKNGTYLS